MAEDFAVADYESLYRSAASGKVEPIPADAPAA
jgi:hypothetical protein